MSKASPPQSPDSSDKHTSFDPNRVLDAVLKEVRSDERRKAQPLNDEHNPVQRDLDWLLQAPELLNLLPLLTHTQQQLSIRRLPKPDKTFIVEAHYASGHRRLGLYAEDLLSAYFSNPGNPYILIARNLQIQSAHHNEGRTIGEFDFLAQERQGGRYQHIEMACKFYLGLPIENPDSKTGNSQWQHWMGPNCNDRLDIKMVKFIEQQLFLSQHPAAQERLAELAISPVDAQYLLRGRLFYPAFSPMPDPELADPEHLKGLWISHSEAGKFLKEVEQRWGQCWFTQLHKLEFMAARPRHQYQQTALPTREFAAYIDEYFASQARDLQTLENKAKQKKHSTMPRPLPLVMSPNHIPSAYSKAPELRLFVVPDSWLEIALKQTETPTPLQTATVNK
ncbi:DUF1853 family protein [Pseudoteredinibacter isoporae]|uniref:DUF1853 family protein n=1 Tax=Pseudoteredinibacter isoporae TaxID=570281 RepID=A0A7X0MVQ2_9GAMM|nr:DUF1853 family protein [Pseudoteredinibacter isoporae]MBB6521643.1 hypothetical protein [Pseudoteredinibacter isoporae]NHO87196.1 DUF1853 family protein [Pseudoteredinibacter isoporae]NIB23020.1 DUF1853 family protein [Pseudoteredinibacter isoporae]